MQFTHVILDRDGVLNREESQGWITTPAQWTWESGALEGLALLCKAGIEVSVATNQSCIGRGLATAAAVEALHVWMSAEARSYGGRIDLVLFCPHVAADACRCRKPKAGLIEQALSSSPTPRARTLVIGDSRRDLEAGRAAGLCTALVRTGKGRCEESGCLALADWVFDDLRHAAQCLTGARAFPNP
jgi:D-glycero-D-manno-heptose 1,7-bisphosphate phosphatase